MLQPDLLSFVQGSIRSVWELELLLLLRKQPERVFARDELVRELRATPALIGRCVEQLQSAGLLACEGAGCRYAPASPALQALCDELETAYRERPVALIAAIVSSPDERLKNFADAFRLKEKDE